jgi:hypothetical protein
MEIRRHRHLAVVRLGLGGCPFIGRQKIRFPSQKGQIKIRKFGDGVARGLFGWEFRLDPPYVGELISIVPAKEAS